MIVYGMNPVRELVRSNPERIRSISIAREARKRCEGLIAEAGQADVAVRLVPAPQIDKLARGAVHNGVVADVEPVSMADFEDVVSDDSSTFVLLLDEVQDPQNLGAILRVADCFGVDLVVTTEHESAGLTSAAIKASAGASEWVRMSQVTNLARSIERLKELGYWVYAAAMGGDPPAAVDFSGKVAIVLGNEGKGIRRNVLEHCDRVITIPISGRVDSLNVATAAAVLCYEVRRQVDR